MQKVMSQRSTGSGTRCIHANIFPGWSKVNLATLQGDCLHINCFESYSQNNPVVVTYQNNLRRSCRFSWCRNKMLQFNYNIMLVNWLLRILRCRWTTQMLLNVKVGLCFDHLSFVILLVTLVTLINVLTWNSAQMCFKWCHHKSPYN